MNKKVTYKTSVDETTGETKTVMILPDQHIVDKFHSIRRNRFNTIMNNPLLSEEFKRGFSQAYCEAGADLFSALLPPLSIL
jgi:hypothetical protein